MFASEKDAVQGRRLQPLLAAALILAGFVAVTLYMASTILYPLLQFGEFVGLALHNNIMQLLLGRYVGYLPLMVFGIVSVTVGNLLWFTKKEIDHSILAMISMLIFTTFAILMLKIFATCMGHIC